MVKFFAWLLSKARVQSWASLLRKNIMFVAEAICPISQAPLETANHIFLECQFARRFWATAGFQFPGDADVRLLHEYRARRGARWVCDNLHPPMSVESVEA
jgi:hypothetical protein